MRIDLFEFVESVFRGFVYFFYNAFETLWDLTVSPWRGPVRRHRAYNRKGHRQIGGLTFLFILIFAIFGLASILSRDNAVGVLRQAPDLNSDAVWLPLLGAMIATVIIDTALRLSLRMRFPRRPMKRGLLLSLTEYSLTWPVIFACLLPLILFVGSNTLDALFTNLLLVVGLWAIAMAACAPAAAFLLSGRRGAARRPRKRRFAMQALVQSGTFALTVVALYTGAFSSLWLSSAGPSDAEPRVDTLEVVLLRCLRDGPALEVVAGLHNPTADPVPLDVDRDLELELNGYGTWNRPGPKLRLAATEGPDALPLLIAAGGTQVVGMTAEGRVSAGQQCRLGNLPGGPRVETANPVTIDRKDSVAAAEGTPNDAF